MNILEVVNAVTGTNPRLVTQANGGEYSSPCPFCGGNKRFRTWPQKKDGQGRWWCRECGETGDSIDLL
ncbi:MAG: primase-helicase zinc-binding domain-containing protein, partial [Pseudomonadota bacterium]|nr:primase-helicase zinc-binding domain-containing protein [Pseudomonadota bacterium]